MHLSKLHTEFQSARILVAGDLMLDEYLSGSVSRISPEAPVPILDLKSRTYLAGGAANVAVNVQTLGGSATLVGLVSSDHAGGNLQRILRTWNVNLDGLVDGGERGTISKTRIVAGQQQIVRIDHEDRTPLSPELESRVVDVASKLLLENDVCVLSDYAKGSLSAHVCEKLIQLAQEYRKPVIVDPKGRSFQKYAGCSIITPNLHEATVATGMTVEGESSLFEAGRRLLEMLPGSRVLITRGADGMTLFSESVPPVTVPALARRVFDIVGAGDTVVATLALAAAVGLPLEISMRLAVVTASIVVGKPGTATATLEEVLQNEDYHRLIQL